jgi:hypothetical protein
MGMKFDDLITATHVYVRASWTRFCVHSFSGKHVVFLRQYI